MYSWLRDGLIPGVSALLISLWLYAWFSFFLATGDGTATMRYPFAWLLELVLVPALAGRFLDRTRWGPAWLHQYGLPAVVIGSFIGFMVPYHAVGVAWLAGFVLLALGVWLALGEVSSQAAAGWFLGGFAAFLGLLGLLLFARVPAFEPDRQGLGLLLAIYLLAGLSWLGLIRQQEMEEHAFRRAANQLNGTWLMLLSGISAGMIGAVALVSFAGGDILVGILRAVAAVIGLIWQAATYVAANWLGPALVWLFGLLHFRQGQEAGGRLLGRRPLVNPDATILAWLQRHLPVPVLLALVFSMLIALVAIWLAGRYRGRISGDDEERSSVWSWALFWSQLRQMLRGIRRSFGGRPIAASPAEPQPPLVASSIRQLYRAVLRWCTEHERPRAPAATPLEFEPALDEEVGSDLSRDLTSAYVLARYAEANLASDQIRELRERWESFTN